MDFRFIFISIFSLYFLVSCIPNESRFPHNQCEWRVKNSTGDTIFLLRNFSVSHHVVIPNDSMVMVFEAGILQRDEGKEMFRWLLDAIVAEDSLTVFNKDHVKLKTWIESQRNDPGKQFFNEKYWEKRKWESGYMFHEWTFELLPEDIQN